MRILAPHKSQEGWVYLRLQVTRRTGGFVHFPIFLDPREPSGHTDARYDDAPPEKRVISSRRVEEAVETADFLKLCADERLTVVRGYDEWHVGLYCSSGIAGKPLTSLGVHSFETAPTLREAYYRYRAAERSRYAALGGVR